MSTLSTIYNVDSEGDEMVNLHTPTKGQAVTLKDFEGIQFLGVEMYYEFLDNLDLLNKFFLQIILYEI